MLSVLLPIPKIWSTSSLIVFLRKNNNIISYLQIFLWKNTTFYVNAIPFFILRRYNNHPPSHNRRMIGCECEQFFSFIVKFVLKLKKIILTPNYFLYLCNVKPYRKPTKGQRRARHIYIKGVTVRFGFDVLELRNFECLSKTKQRERLMGVLYTAIIIIGSY